jgi:peptide deformylase
MTTLDIYTYPNAFLKKKASPVQNIDGNFQTIIDKMAETMYLAPGLGLAAIQVGVDQSLIVYDVSDKEDGHHLQVLINPRIIDRQGEMVSAEEGCLSVPEFRADVIRAEQVFVEGFDRDGNPKKIEASGLLSIVLQHEIDHLNGTLFIDRISPLKRRMYKRKVQKQLKRQ